MQTKDTEILPGGMPIFRPEDISLLDINDLIDKGLRFGIKPGLEDDRYTDIRKYLEAK